jgi:hypothetical protein
MMPGAPAAESRAIGRFEAVWHASFVQVLQFLLRTG